MFSVGVSVVSANSPAGPDRLYVLVLQGLSDDDARPELGRVVPRVLLTRCGRNTLETVGVDGSALGFRARGVPKVELAGCNVRLDGRGVKRGRLCGFRCGHHPGRVRERVLTRNRNKPDLVHAEKISDKTEQRTWVRRGSGAAVGGFAEAIL